MTIIDLLLWGRSTNTGGNMALKKKTPLTKEEKPTEVTLVWPHHVDLSSGLGASAYGIKLVMVDGFYRGTMSADRAAAELSRSNGPTFYDE